MAYKKILFSLILFLFTVSFLNSQSTTWTKVYGGSDDDFAYSVKQTPDGGYIVIGRTKSFGSYYINAWLLKIDQYGDTIWTKVYDSIRGLNDIEVDYDNGYIFVGSICTANPSISDLIIVKTDINGDSLWSKRYNLYYLNTYCSPYDIDKTSDSCYVIAGNAMFGNSQGFIFKIDQYGDSIWASVFGDEMYFTSICETSDKGFFTTVQTHPWKEVSLVKFDSLGNWIYYKMIIDTLNTKVRDIEKLKDNNYIMISSSYLVKIDSSSDTLKSKPDSGWDITPTECGGYCIVGKMGDYFSGNIFLMKFNSDSDSLWYAEYGGPNYDCGKSIEQTIDGGYIIAGYTESFGFGGKDYYIIKTDSLGYALGIEEQLTNNNPEYFNISYISKQNGEIEFNFTLPQSDNVKLEIFDLSGRLISTPISDNFSKGEHEINITLPNNGVYIYRFTSSISEQSGKFLVF